MARPTAVTASERPSKGTSSSARAGLRTSHSRDRPFQKKAWGTESGLSAMQRCGGGASERG